LIVVLNFFGFPEPQAHLIQLLQAFEVENYLSWKSRPTCSVLQLQNPLHLLVQKLFNYQVCFEYQNYASSLCRKYILIVIYHFDNCKIFRVFLQVFELFDLCQLTKDIRILCLLDLGQLQTL